VIAPHVISHLLLQDTPGDVALIYIFIVDLAAHR